MEFISDFLYNHFLSYQNSHLSDLVVHEVTEAYLN